MKRTCGALSLVLICACGPDDPNDSPATTGASRTSTNGEASTTADEESSTEALPPTLFRRFGGFHFEDAFVGYENEGEQLMFVWLNLTISPDMTVSQSGFWCTSDHVDNKYGWEHVNEREIRIVSPDVDDAGQFLWGTDRVVEVTLRETDSCGEIESSVRYLDPERPVVTSTYAAGRTCPQGEGCLFEIVWCDGSPPPPCE